MKLNIESEKFDIPPLEKVAESLNIGLKENYKDVNVQVVDCPNLKLWGCPAEGISGNEKIIDVGGEPYMHDPKFLGIEFDYEEISKKNWFRKIICSRGWFKRNVMYGRALWGTNH